MSLGCFSGFSKRAKAHYDDPPLTPKITPTSSTSASAQPRKSAIRQPGDSPCRPHSVVTHTNSVGDYVQAVQAFRSVEQDELDVVAGQKLKVLYVEGEWSYVSTCHGSPHGREKCGFVPTNFCKRLVSERVVTFADDKPPTNANGPYRTAPMASPSPNLHTSAPHNLARCPSSDSAESDYVALRAPTQSEQVLVEAGFPYKARVMYNFSDESIDRVCVRRGEEVTVLGRDAMDSGWTMAHRSNGQQGLVPTCFLQHACPTSSATSPLPPHRHSSTNSSVFAPTPGMQDSNQPHSAGVIVYPSPSAQRPAPFPVSEWVDKVSEYNHSRTSPGHSTASSDSGYADPRQAMGSATSPPLPSRNPVPPPFHGHLPDSKRQSGGRPVPCTETAGFCGSASSKSTMPCKQTSSADSGNCHDDQFEFPPPPAECLVDAEYDEVDCGAPSATEHGARKLAGRRQLGPKTLEKTPNGPCTGTIDELADHLVAVACSYTPKRTQPQQAKEKSSKTPDQHRTPPPVAPKPKVSPKAAAKPTKPAKPSPKPVHKPSPEPVHSSSPKPVPNPAPKPARSSEAARNQLAKASPKPVQTSSPLSTAPSEKDEEDECLLVVSQFKADSPDKLSVEKGDIVHGDPSTAAECRGWVWVYCPRLDECGFIPVVYTQRCNTDGVGGVITEI